MEGKAKVIIKRPSTSNYYYGGAVVVDGGGGDFVAVEEPAFKPPDEWDSSGSSSSSGSSGYPNEVSDILYESSWMTLYEGSATFVASISKSMLDQQWSRNLEAYAMVEEAATREIRNSTVLIVPIVREAFMQQTSMIYQSPALKPGLPMKHTIQLASDIPGAFSDTEDLGTLDFTLNINKMNSYSYSGDSNAQTISTRVSSSGALDIEFDAPANDLSCCASYEDETNYFYGSSQKCCLQGANVQLVKNAASRDVVKKILASAAAICLRRNSTRSCLTYRCTLREILPVRRLRLKSLLSIRAVRALRRVSSRSRLREVMSHSRTPSSTRKA